MSSVSSSSSGILPLLEFSRGDDSSLNLPWRDVHALSFEGLDDLNITSFIASREEVKIDGTTAAPLHLKFPCDVDNHATTGKTCSLGKEEEEDSNYFTRLFPVTQNFEEHYGAVRIESASMLISQLDVLVDRAKNEKVSRNKGATWNKPTLSVLLHMGSLLGVNLNSVFAAIEIFDRFTVDFNDILEPTIRELMVKGDSSAELAETRSRLRSQVPLRMASCLQLAHKLHCDLSTPDLTLATIESALTSLSFLYTKTAIAKSETRVFASLNFRLGYLTPWEVSTTLLASIPNLSPAARAEVAQLTASLLFMTYEHHSCLLDALWEIHVAGNPKLPVAWKNGRCTGNGCSKLVQERETWRSGLYQEMSVLFGGGALATAFTILQSVGGGEFASTSSSQKRDMTKEIARYLRTPVMRVSDVSIAMLRVAVCTVPDFLESFLNNS